MTDVAQWASATTYAPDALVVSQGVIWRAVAGSTGVHPGSDSAKWVPWTTNADVPAPPGSDSGASGVPIADATATTAEVDNPAAGGTMNVLEIPDDSIGVGFKRAGDDFPFLYITGDDRSVYLGNGTYDPYDNGRAIKAAFLANGTTKAIKLETTTCNQFECFDIDSVNGPKLHAPNDTVYRIVVANDGTLSTELA